jgi:hypothetical protein
MELHGADNVECFTDTDTECFLELPDSLGHCSIGPMTWEIASAYLECKKDPTYLPNLQASSVLWLYHDERVEHKAEVDEYNTRRTMAAGDEHAFAFRLRWDDERKE